MKKFLIPLMVISLLSSCVSQKKFIYLQTSSNTTEETLSKNKLNKRILPKDDIYINISSISQATGLSLNQVSESGGGLAQTDFTMVSYTVNDSGFVTLPAIGKVYAQNKTAEELSNDLQEILKTYIDQPYVIVKIINKNIAVIGEVRTPGNYRYSGDKLTIFNALALAGDVTDYGNRNRVLVIREKDNEVIKKYVDLTKNDIFASDYYYLQSNDIVYVQPLNARYWSTRNLPYGLVLAALTTMTVMYNVFLNQQ
jgi:polysaccharide export outer membrane protein